MAVKPMVSIGVDDAEFEAFQKAFDKYTKQLAKTPEAWKAVNKATKDTAKNFAEMRQVLSVQLQQMRDQAAEQLRIEQISKQSAFNWGTLATHSKSVANNIASATRSIIKWSSVSALLGLGGSIFGLDRLAAIAGSGRSSAQGLGINYGGKKAFDAQFSRVIDTGALLGGVSQAKGDVGSEAFGALQALGIDVNKGDTGQVGVEVLRKLREIAKNNPEGAWGPLISGLHLGSVGGSVESLRGLSVQSDGDFEKWLKDYQGNSKATDVADPALKAMQDFTVAMNLAKDKIEATFITALAPLTPELTDLSNTFQDFVRDFIKSDGFKEIILSVTEGLRDFAKYVKTEQFKTDVKDFITGVGDLAKSISSALKWLGVIPDKNAPQPVGPTTTIPGTNATISLVPGGFAAAIVNKFRAIAGLPPLAGSMGSTALPGVGPGSGAHNPGNLRDNSRGGFQEFSSDAEGFKAMAGNLFAYQKAGVDTISSIISKWAPPNENNTALYIKQMADWVGVDKDKKLDLSHDEATLTKLMSAMAQKEGRVTGYSPQQIQVMLHAAPGTNISGASAAMSPPAGVPANLPNPSIPF